MLADYFVSIGWQAVNFVYLRLLGELCYRLLVVETEGGLEEREVVGQRDAAPPIFFGFLPRLRRGSRHVQRGTDISNLWFVFRRPGSAPARPPTQARSSGKCRRTEHGGRNLFWFAALALRDYRRVWTK